MQAKSLSKSGVVHVAACKLTQKFHNIFALSGGDEAQCCVCGSICLRIP